MSELKHMNDGVSESQKYGDNSVKDSEPFKRNYASVLKQLTEANEQAWIFNIVYLHTFSFQ